MKYPTIFFAAGVWVVGTVLATGWLKVVSLFFPFYAWYLVAERLMLTNGIVP